MHKYSVEHEERNVWKVYLEKKDFAAAIRYCSNDESKLDQVGFGAKFKKVKIISR